MDLQTGGLSVCATEAVMIGSGDLYDCHLLFFFFFFFSVFGLTVLVLLYTVRHAFCFSERV